MKTEKIFIRFMAVFFVLAILYLFLKNSDSGVASDTLAMNDKAQISTLFFETKTTGSTGAGDALVELAPQASDKNTLVVKFRINTHSVDLSGFDLTQITTLEYEDKVVVPAKASRIGGHHSSGTIVFDNREAVSSFKIRIKGIPRINERVYEWDVG